MADIPTCPPQQLIEQPNRKPADGEELNNTINQKDLSIYRTFYPTTVDAHSFHITLEHDTKINQTLDHKANVKFVEELKEFTN